MGKSIDSFLYLYYSLLYMREKHILYFAYATERVSRMTVIFT